MKRVLLWGLGALVAVVVAVVLAFTLSPWPSVAVIAYIFSQGEQASEAALEKYIPAGIQTQRDLHYGSGSDERFDINVAADATAPRRAIVWIHGGAWIAGNKVGIANYLKVLAGNGFTTVAVEYSTGYGATYPKPVEQVNAALGYLVRNAAELKIDPAAIILAGDSAGAQIAAQVALLVTDPAYARAMAIQPQLPPERLAAVLLLSGTYDMRTVNLTGDYDWFVRTVLWAYSGVRNFAEDKRFALASVTAYVGQSFPPSFISSGNGDPLMPQAVALAKRLKSLDVTVDSLFFPPDTRPALPHEYQFNLDTAPGQEALRRMMAFAKASAPRTKNQQTGPQ